MKKPKNIKIVNITQRKMGKRRRVADFSNMPGGGVPIQEFIDALRKTK